MTEPGEQRRLLEPGPPPRRRSRRTTTRRANQLDGATWTRYSISIWSDIRKTPEELALRHPAMFPVQLASRLIQCFTTEEERIILDPFVGVGSTAIAAEALGKTGIGFDVSQEFVQKARQRPPPPGDMFASPSDHFLVGERRIHLADANDLLRFLEPESVDMVVTSPPYWDILLQERTADYKAPRHYGDSGKDLGKVHDYETFLGELACIFEKVYTVLKAERYCCVVVMDLRKKDRFFPYHTDLARRMEDIGFVFDDIIVWDRRSEYNNLRPLGHPAVFRINKAHEYILIFKKP